MASVNIVIRAVNSAKGAFQEVGNQAQALNKKLAMIGNVFKGLFIGGVAVKLIKMFVGASTESEKLKESVERIKKPFMAIAAIIGNVIVKALHLIAPIIEGIGKAAQWAFQLFETEAQTAARNAEMAQRALADEHKKLEAEKADAEKKRIDEIKDEEEKLAALRKHWADEEKRVTQEKADLDKQLFDAKKAREEKGMRPELLMERRKKELETRQADLDFYQRGGFTLKAAQAEVDIEGLLGEIDQLQSDINDAMDEANTAAHEAWIEQEKEKGEAVKSRLTEQTRLEIEAIEKQAAALEEAAKQKIESIGKAAATATDLQSRTQQRLRAMEAGSFGARRESVKEVRERLTNEAAADMAKADALRNKAAEIAEKSEQHLKSIEEKLDALLTLK